MKVVYIAHQISGDIENNVKKILEICHKVHKEVNNIIPFAPYLVALQYLDDTLSEERELGISANIEFFKRRAMDEIWLCWPRISEWMIQEIKLWVKFDIPIACYNSDLKRDLDEILRTIKENEK